MGVRAHPTPGPPPPRSRRAPTARHPSPDAPVLTLGDMPRAMVVRPHIFGIPMHCVCHDLTDGHVAVMPTTVYLTLRFPAASNNNDVK
jgi:hypothetical protein